MNYIDLFAGPGGLSLGFDNAGFENVFAIDSDFASYTTYKQNLKGHFILNKKIEELGNPKLKILTKGKDVDVVIGGPPCQGFSMAGRIGRLFIDDPRNKLFKEFARVVSVINPKYFVMENVARLFNHNNGRTREEIINTFENMDYNVDCRILCSANYCVPQIRNRVIFIGNRVGRKNIFPNKNIRKYVTVKEAIGNLPKLNAGESLNIPNHEAMNHTKKMLEKMRYVPNGGNRSSIPKKIRPQTGDVRKYIRYDSDKPSICITGDMRKVFHYEQNRALTVRELARLQSFPDNFVFFGSKISQQQQVGNAVPPKMSEAIANCIREVEDE